MGSTVTEHNKVSSSGKDGEAKPCCRSCPVYQQESQYIVRIEPFQVTKADAIKLLASERLVQRLIHASIEADKRALSLDHPDRWIIITKVGGRGCETMIDYQSLKHAYHRIRLGKENPPLLPSELKQKEGMN